MNRVKYFAFSLGLIAVLFGVHAPVSVVHACSCVQATRAEQFDNANVVFLGTVENVSSDGWSQSVDFLVHETLKGDIDENVTVTTGMGGGDCGFDFMFGKPYVVYAYEEGGKLGTGICSGTYSPIDSYESSAVETASDNTVEDSSAISYVGIAIAAFIGGSVATRLVLKGKK